MSRKTINCLKCNFHEFEFALKRLQNNQIVIKTTDFTQGMQFGGLSHLPPPHSPDTAITRRPEFTTSEIKHLLTSVILPIYETNIKKEASNLKKSKKERLLFGHTEKKIYFCG